MWKSKTGKPVLDHEISFWMFKGNYLELKGKALVSAQIMHIKMDMKGEGEDLNIDAVRAFYNFLMSAATLVDHYRVLVQSDKLNQEFKIEYDQKLQDTFHNDILAICVKKLRNFTTHKSLPACLVSPGDSVFNNYKLYIDVTDLKDWDGWNRAEKEYLESLDDRADVLTLLDPYFTKAEIFYRWFMRRYCDLHPAEKSDLGLLYEKDLFS